MKIPTSLRDNTLFLMGECSKSVRDKVLAVIRNSGYDISPEQFTILVTLLYNDGIKQSALVKTIFRDKTTISRVLSRMVKNGLITKKNTATSTRENTIFITAKGKEIQQELIQHTGPIYTQTMKNIDDKDIEVVNRTLLQFIENINEP